MRLHMSTSLLRSPDISARNYSYWGSWNSHEKYWTSHCRHTFVAWANVDQVLCHHKASLGHNEFIWLCILGILDNHFQVDKITGFRRRIWIDMLQNASPTIHKEPLEITMASGVKHYISISLFKIMMTSSNGNIFRVTGPLCGEFTGHPWIPRTKASDAEPWCFLWYSPQ